MVRRQRSVLHEARFFAVGALQGRKGFSLWLLAVLGLALAVQALFFGLITAVQLVPSDVIVAKLAQSEKEGLWDTVDYPRDGVGRPTSEFPFAGITDAYTECIALTIGISGDPTRVESSVVAAVQGRHLGTCSFAVPAIGELVAGNPAAQEFTYSRYWNGYTILSRPLIAIAGVGAARVAFGIIALGGAIAAFVMLARRTRPAIAVALMVPLAVSTNALTQPLHGGPHALSLGVILFGVAAGAAVAANTRWQSILVIAALSAAAFNFVDFLLNPPIAWAWFVASVALSAWFARPRDIASVLRASGAATIGWMAGYALSFLARWALSVLVLGPRAWDEIMSVVGTRLSGENEALVIPGVGQPTLRNVEFWLQTIPVAPATLAVASIIVLGVAAAAVWRHGIRAVLWLATLAAPVVLIVIWLESLSNHSQIHLFFVYRAIPAAIGVVLAAAVAVLCAPKLAASRSTAQRASAEGDGVGAPV